MIKEIVMKAYDFAKNKHEGQKRKFTGQPYFVHCKYVSRVIEHLTKKPDLVAVALLHDVIEDTITTLEDIRIEFGNKIASLVDKLTNKKEERGKRKKVDYMHWKFRNLSSDALTIKLADRFHNILSLEQDCRNKEQLSFLMYHYTNTISIFKNLDKDLSLNKVQKAIYDRIFSVLKFFEIRYEFKGK